MLRRIRFRPLYGPITDDEAVGDVILYILKVEVTHGETCNHEPIVISRLNRMGADENDADAVAERSSTIGSVAELLFENFLKI